jgi:hypothetical protein
MQFDACKKKRYLGERKKAPLILSLSTTTVFNFILGEGLSSTYRTSGRVGYTFTLEVLGTRSFSCFSQK